MDKTTSKVFAAIIAATSAGAALDAIPEKWPVFISRADMDDNGPYKDRWFFALCPPDAPPSAKRAYAGGYYMGHGATRLAAMIAAVEWLMSRYVKKG